MTQRYTDEAIRAKIRFADEFEASIERDSKSEIATGSQDRRVEERRRALYTFADATVEAEPS